jgi:hypothetical protein
VACLPSQAGCEDVVLDVEMKRGWLPPPPEERANLETAYGRANTMRTPESLGKLSNGAPKKPP